MIALRHLSVFYLAAASSFAVAATLSQHPTWNAAAHDGARFVGEKGGAAAVALNDYLVQPSWALTKSSSVVVFKMAANEFNMLEKKAAQPLAVLAQTKPVARHIEKPVVVASVQPKKNIAPPPAAPALRPPIIEAPSVQTPAPQDRTVASASPPNFTLAPEVTKPIAPPAAASVTQPPVDSHPPSAAELAQVADHFRNNLTKEMLDNFELFLFISKANANNSIAQRMYVFQKQASGDLVLLHNWPVSTGREKVEYTPSGIKAPSFTST